jgi:hypothetical protein
MITKPTLEELKKYLCYYPETGVFVWTINRGRKIKAGSVAGGIDIDRGYYNIGFNDKTIELLI